MKKIYLLIILAGLISFSSCELDKLPYNSLTAEDLEKDKQDTFDKLMVGVYGHLKKWSDAMHRVGEYPADNIMIRGSSTDAFYSYIAYNPTPNNGRLYTFWANSYKVIAQTSDIMMLANEGETKELDQKLGEAYYMRGMSFFYLCRVFGRPYDQSPETNLGVPVVLTGSPKTEGEINSPDRSTVKETYAQAIRDLRKAEKLMTIPNTAAYATKEAAQAMLSRVYLYMSGTYDSPNTMYADSAIYYANEVINSNRYDLVSRPNLMRYNEFAPDDKGQTETIFAVKQVDTEFSGSDHYYGIGGMYAEIDGVGWGEMYASAKYIALLEKAGKGKDAREAFIRPQYYTIKKDGENKVYPNLTKGEKVPSFRFITNRYVIEKDQNNIPIKKTHVGYSYVQDTLRVKPTGDYFVKVENVEYPLTLVNATENKYSIQYDGKTIVGDKDYVMLLNMGYPKFFIYKCSLQDGKSHLHSPIISRLAEMYLNLAEAYAKKGQYGPACTNLNMIRGRALPGEEYPSLNAANASQLIDEERQLELAFEAHRTFDVYRNGQTMSRHYPGPHPSLEDVLPTDKRVVQFIPQKEIDAYYPAILTQNPTYK